MEPVLLHLSGSSLGLLRVMFDPACKARVLYSGSTRHGLQSIDSARADEPLAYYQRTGPIGDIFAGWRPGPGGRVGIVGLGAGSIAAYAQPGQHFTFYEIDPAVARIAGDPRCFTFLSRCRGDCTVEIGDGLELLRQTDDAIFDMLVLDAFMDSAIPAHLLTVEAVEVYWRKLRNEGLLVFHINTNGALLPELARLATQAGRVCLFRADVNLTDAELASGKLPSHYVVMARHRDCVAWLAEHPRWTAACAADPPAPSA